MFTVSNFIVSLFPLAQAIGISQRLDLGWDRLAAAITRLYLRETYMANDVGKAAESAEAKEAVSSVALVP
ncbi:hypothetical protein D8674_031564 [Pyrus ussuriensis x Pyrus communis]|uniref:Uncharacterized protein n=1 Tax=Pyrus ussuriensis x Pyrus communis TaxID=2448454 RepID=A0A5N5FC92_9ROSA|nr:hypothetical protein D8674_031564 [Pyrus ussuriensis x Pyrus communis]